jgi:hypothetical protein
MMTKMLCSIAVLSNLVAIHHMWRQEILMRKQTIVQKWISNGKFSVYLSNSDKSGDSKTVVVNVVGHHCSRVNPTKTILRKMDV